MEHKGDVNLELEKKIFVVTGASKGIGRAIAARLLQEGAKVALLARGHEALSLAESNFRKKHEEKKIKSWVVDCCDEEQLQSVKGSIIKCWDKIDGVVANVGDGRSVPDPIPEKEQWNRIWQKNFETALNTARVFLPTLKENSGSMLFISSITGLSALGAPVDYSTAKTAVIAFAKNLARKVAPEIRVNVIAPGNVFIPGGSWEEKLKLNPGVVNEMLNSEVPLKRFGKPDEIADAAVFLCSKRASFITGTVLRVDGGQISNI